MSQQNGQEILHEGWRFAAMFGSADGTPASVRDRGNLKEALWAVKVAKQFPLTDLHLGTGYDELKSPVLSFAHSAHDMSTQLIPWQRANEPSMLVSHTQAYSESVEALETMLAGKSPLVLQGIHMGSERLFHRFHVLPGMLYMAMPEQQTEHQFWSEGVYQELSM